MQDQERGCEAPSRQTDARIDMHAEIRVTGCLLTLDSRNLCVRCVLRLHVLAVESMLLPPGRTLRGIRLRVLSHSQVTML